MAESLARAGFAVRVPDLPGARRLTLDPSRAALSTCTLAIRGLADPVIPWTQAAALVAALPPGRGVAVLVPGFGHVEPAGLPPAGQLALIWAMAVAELAQRQRSLRRRPCIGPGATNLPPAVKSGRPS